MSKLIEDLERIVDQDEIRLRDHFAGLAMQGEISRWDGESGSIDYETTARRAYKMADAMLKARKENSNG